METTMSSYMELLAKHFRNNDANAMRELSNETIEKAALAGDKALVAVSLVAYALGKLGSKTHLLKEEQWKEFREHVLGELERKEEPAKVLEHIIAEIGAFDASVGNYVVDVVQKARIKQAAHAYGLGVSLSKAADLTGADKEELLSYVGFTKIHDRPFAQTKSAAERFAIAREVLG